MTVADLIEVLQQSPNLKVPVTVRVVKRNAEGDRYVDYPEIDDARFDGNKVILERER